MENLEQLEKTIEEVNEFLLAPHDPISQMDDGQLKEFVIKLEQMYKKSIQIKLHRSVRKFTAGLDFEEYKNAQKAKEVKARTRAATTEQKKLDKGKKTADNILKGLGLDLGAILQAKENYCMTHKKLKTECGCGKES